MNSINRIIKQIFVFILLCMTFQNTKAQSYAGSLQNGAHSISILTGIEYAILPIIVRYDHAISAFKYKYPFEIGVELSMPLISPDLNDVRLKGSVSTTAYKNGLFIIRTQISPVFVRNSMETLRINSLGLEVGALIGLASEKWNVGIDINATKMMSSHIFHKEKYRENVFQDAVDGWYKNTASNIQMGILVNRRVRKCDILFEAGLSKTGQFNNYLLVPSMYLKMGAAYRF